ncbi:hypothetical protein [Nocardioides alkalitolerans]|uniref:hypothetical protein n=1 Tax=Nocardioides alkalitolerans TaxID=281714 RepID=UPI00048D8096|nr:hypothetical protein [Nocardioides alkalitolerans]
MARSTQVAARERAREALRRREAERAARDGMITQAAADYFAGELLVEDGTAKMRAAIVALVDELDETPASAATLLGLTVREVKKLRRDAAAQTSTTDSSVDADGSAADANQSDDQDRQTLPQASEPVG